VRSELFGEVILEAGHELVEWELPTQGLPPDGFDRVRSERLTEILQQRDEPSAIAGKRFASLLYGEGAYGNSVVGNAGSVARITPDVVRRFYQQHFVPNNSSVVVAGDVPASEGTAMVERAFGSWTRGAEPPRPTVTPRSIESSRIYIIDRPQAVQSEIRIGHIGVPRSCEDYFPLSVMNALLGGVFNSRINLNLREKHGYTYGARSAFAFRRQAGPFVVAAPAHVVERMASRLPPGRRYHRIPSRMRIQIFQSTQD